MNLKIGYYPIMDMVLGLRQLCAVERFKPYTPSMTNIDNKLVDSERMFINNVGEVTRDWLHIIEKLINITLSGIVSPEEFILYINKNPELIVQGSVNIEETKGISKVFKDFWQNYFNQEVIKYNKTVFEKVIEISENVDKKGLMNFLVETSDRIVKIDENTMKFLIKPEHFINISNIENVLIMPSVFASRKLTFWHNENNYIFYVSIDSKSEEKAEPSDMMLLKTLALNDKTRLKMLRMLMEGNYSTNEMADVFKMNPSTISRHFKVFKDAGFVEIFNQEGNTVYYSINIEEINAALEDILDYIKGEQ